MSTEKRLIDANALIASGYNATLDKVFPNWWELPDSTKEAVCEHGQYLKKLINELPTVDAVEVIRCKNCKEKCEYSPNQFYCLLSGMPIDGDDFCSLGAKMDGEKV